MALIAEVWKVQRGGKPAFMRVAAEWGHSTRESPGCPPSHGDCSRSQATLGFYRPSPCRATHSKFKRGTFGKTGASGSGCPSVGGQLTSAGPRTTTDFQVWWFAYKNSLAKPTANAGPAPKRSAKQPGLCRHRPDGPCRSQRRDCDQNECIPALFLFNSSRHSHAQSARSRAA